MITHSRSWSAITVLAFAALALFVQISTHARAAGPWYVAPGGNDGNTCLSTGSPCATINGAIGKAIAGDTIMVATGVFTSTTGSEVVLIDKSATLSGGWDAAFTTQSGMSTIDGDGARRGITENVGVTAILERFLIQNGSTEDLGGGIKNNGTLTMNYSTVSGNTSQFAGGGIANSGTLTLNNSTISGNTTQSQNAGGSGGILNGEGILTLNNSTVRDNTTNQYAGGIANCGTVILNNSIVSGNTSQSGGGGIANECGTVTLNNSTVSGNTSQSVGGIENDGTLNLTNSTISGNTGYAGGIRNWGTVTLKNSTVSGNSTACNSGINTSGGIDNLSGNMTLQNTILAGNTANEGGPDCIGTLNSAGYNLIGNTAGCVFNSTTGDLLNTNPKMFSGLIGSPGYHPLLSGSPAIDAGNPATPGSGGNACETTDQRGEARVGRCDIGAYEYDGSFIFHQVFLPLTTKSGGTTSGEGIHGQVKFNGAAAAGELLYLLFFDGSSREDIATTTTGTDGSYSFTCVPSLTPGQGQYYRVIYQNNLNNGRLGLWNTRKLTIYTAGSAVAIGDFDIADIALVSPADGATVSLPYNFQWTPRPATPSDSYDFELYDDSDFEPYFSTEKPLGYVGSYNRNSLPEGFNVGELYVWDICVLSPDDGIGCSNETREVYFSNSGFSATNAAQPKHPKTAPNLDDRLKR